MPTNEVCDYTAIAAASGGVVEEGLPVRREERVESWIKEEYISGVGEWVSEDKDWFVGLSNSAPHDGG